MCELVRGDHRRPWTEGFPGDGTDFWFSRPGGRWALIWLVEQEDEGWSRRCSAPLLHLVGPRGLTEQAKGGPHRDELLHTAEGGPGL